MYEYVSLASMYEYEYAMNTGMNRENRVYVTQTFPATTINPLTTLLD